jgi:hypothetical protein
VSVHAALVLGFGLTFRLPFPLLRLLDGPGGGGTGITPTAAATGGVIPHELQWSTSPTSLATDGDMPAFSDMNEDVLSDALFASGGHQGGGSQSV